MPLMSALGQKRTLSVHSMSALPPKADRVQRSCDVCFVPNQPWRSRSRLAPRASTRCPWRGWIRTGSTVPTNPAHSSQAFLKGCEPAISRAAIPSIVIGAPRTVLRISGFFNADDSHKNSQDKYRKSHGYLLLGCSLKTPSIHVLFPAPCSTKRGGLR